MLLPAVVFRIRSTKRISKAQMELQLAEKQMENVRDEVLQAFHDGASNKPNARLAMLHTYVTESNLQTIPLLQQRHNPMAVYAIDLGGTNLRMIRVDIANQTDLQTSVSTSFAHRAVHSVSVPSDYLVGSTQHLFDYLGAQLAAFIQSCDDHHHKKKNAATAAVPVGFCFSFPVEQQSITSGLLLGWTKGYNCSGGIKHDVAQMLTEGALKAGVRISVQALVNDTVGLLAASRADHSECGAACVVGTGMSLYHHKLSFTHPTAAQGDTGLGCLNHMMQAQMELFCRVSWSNQKYEAVSGETMLVLQCPHTLLTSG